MYSKVIVPLDGSELAERALTHARLIAGASNIPLELIEAFDILSPSGHGRRAALSTERMLAEARGRSESYLSEVRARLEDANHQVNTAALPGYPEQAIVDRVSLDPNALVVMSTHGRGGLARWALGSVTDRVLHSVPNPMLIIRAAAENIPDTVDTVLVPLDGSSLAETALEPAANLAIALDARLLLTRVTHPPNYYRSRLAGPRVAAGPPLATWVNDLMRADSEEVTDYLGEVQRRLNAEYPDALEIDTLHLRHENPAQAVIDQAAEGQSIIVMTSHGRGGLGRLMLGSVADRVVRHAEAPVLVVRQQQ